MEKYHILCIWEQPFLSTVCTPALFVYKKLKLLSKIDIRDSSHSSSKKSRYVVRVYLKYPINSVISQDENLHPLKLLVFYHYLHPKPMFPWEVPYLGFLRQQEHGFEPNLKDVQTHLQTVTIKLRSSKDLWFSK